MAADIRSKYTSSMLGGSNLGRVLGAEDAYRSPMQTGDWGWGSNRAKSKQAGTEVKWWDKKMGGGKAPPRGRLVRPKKRGSVS